ncbi:MAG: hypothetical protein GTN59_10690, partial [Candidatus Dadabacteria bacterium]|nr:hypothetical protein [Candidatus Dadabacteria bacterium]
KTKPILERFDLSKKEKQFILDIIRGHMFFHILTTPEKSSDFQKNFAKIKNRYINNIYPELILLCCADTINGGIRKTRPKEYKYRMDFYKKEIKKLSRGL